MTVALSLEPKMENRTRAIVSGPGGAVQTLPAAPRLAYTLPAVTAELARDQALSVETLDDFDAVYEAYYQSIYRAVRAIVLDASLAEDVTQDAFLKAYRSREGFRPVGSVGGWLHKIAVRKAISALRWRKVQEKLLGAVRLRVPHVPMETGLGVQLSQLLQHLGPGTRAAVVLHYFHGYLYREIAVMLGIPEGTVATRIANGLRRMRKLLDASEETPKIQR